MFTQCAEQRLRSVRRSGRGHSSYLSLDQREIQASDAGGLTGAVDSGNRCLLKLVDSHNTAAQLASEQNCKLDLGHKVESACEIVARLFPYGVPSSQRDGV